MEISHDYVSLIEFVFFAGYGLSIIFSAYQKESKNNYLRESGFETKGKIVEIQRVNDENLIKYHYIIVFTTLENIFIKAKTDTTFDKRLPVGSEVVIVYDGNSLHNFVVKKSFEEYSNYLSFITGLLIVLSAFFLFLCFLKS